MNPREYRTTGSRYRANRPSQRPMRSKRPWLGSRKIATTTAMFVGGIVGVISCTPYENEQPEQPPIEATLDASPSGDIRVDQQPTIVTQPTATVSTPTAVALAQRTTTLRPLNEAESAAVELFIERLRELERTRETIRAEFQVVGSEIDASDFNMLASNVESFTSTLDYVIGQQEELVHQVQSLGSPDYVIERTRMLLDFVYTRELVGYRDLRSAARLGRGPFPHRAQGIAAEALRLLRSSGGYRERVDEEAYELLYRLRLARDDEQPAN